VADEMKIPRDERFFEQAAQFELRFCCEHCSFFHEDSETCVHDFPNGEHRESYYARPGEWIIFCKDFELR
jgi:hypothetical protein